MHVNTFIKSRENDWKRLETLTASRRLQPGEIHELGRLYRTVMSDLAIAQRDYPGHQVTLFLNQLLMRTHSFIYQKDTSQFRRVIAVFTHTIPQSFRQMSIFSFAAFLLFIIPAIIGFRLAFIDPSVAQPLGLEEQRQILADHSTWTNIPPDSRSFASTFIITNNIRIAILAFAGGVGFALFTVYVLTINGLIIGAVLGLAAHYGMAGDLLGFIIAHGVLELSIIIIAGGAGLSLGWALLNPGRYTRLDALKLAARRSVYLAILSLPVLLTAGLIEGFISPSTLPALLRLSVGIVTGAILYAYLLLMGHSE